MAKEAAKSKYMRVKDLKVGDVFKFTGEAPELSGFNGTIPKNVLLCTFSYGDAIQAMDSATGCGAYYESAYVPPVEAARGFKLDLTKIMLPNGAVNLTGADPEIFVCDEAGKLIPAFEFLPSQKESTPIGRNFRAMECAGPHPIGAPCNVYYDGFQAEFDMVPGHCHGYGVDRVRMGLSKLRTALLKHNPKASLMPNPVVRLDPSKMGEFTDEQVALGCDPSLNAYGSSGVVVPNPRELPVRFAGGHIHFGMVDPEKVNKPAFVKWMDFFCALPCVGIFATVDDPIRRNFYGRAGEYRDKSYGLEYRVMSNAWLYDPRINHMVWNLARSGTGLASIYGGPGELDFDETEIQRIINETDVDAARAFVAKNAAIYTRFNEMHWGTPYFKERNLFLSLVEEGVEAIFPNFRQIEKNWSLGSYWSYHSNNLKASFGHNYKNWNGKPIL